MTILNMVYGAWWWGWGGWTPWANTLAYWTLDNKLTDETWNYDLTLQNWTFTQLASWRYVLSLEATSTKSWASYTWWPDLRSKNLTWNLWIKDTASRSWFNDWTYIYLLNWTANILNIVHSWPSQGDKIYWVLWNYNNYNDAPTYNDTVWHNVVFTFNNTTYVLNEYIDGALKCTTTLSWWVSNTTWIIYIGKTWYNNTAHLMVWATIIEDKERTAQEVSDYFDQTKADYWVS